MKRNKQQGSVTLGALIFGTVIIILITSLSKTVISHYKTTIRYEAGERAFHLAESGIELAMFAIRNTLLGEQRWAAESTDRWLYSDTGIQLDSNAANIDIHVKDNGDNRYTITSLATVQGGGFETRKAVEVEIKETRSAAQEAEAVGSGVYSYGMIAKDSIKLEHSNPGMKVASYDSQSNLGIPIWGTNTGYDVVVATPATNNDAIRINNSTIHGAIRTGGGTVSYRDTHASDPSQNANILGPDSTNTAGVDSNRVSDDFDAEFPQSDLPTSDGYVLVSHDQNYWQNQSEIHLGSSLNSTWVSTDSLSTKDSTILTIHGDVVIDVNRNVNLAGTLKIQHGASLVLMASENLQITTGTTNHDYPIQLQIIAKKNRDVVLNNFSLFNGVINAPNSNVRLAGTQDSEFRGAVVGRNIEVTNGVSFYYDINLGDGQTNSATPSDANDAAVGEIEINKWAEIAPTAAVSVITAQ